jgi:hypothetical protein
MSLSKKNREFVNERYVQDGYDNVLQDISHFRSQDGVFYH